MRNVFAAVMVVFVMNSFALVSTSRYVDEFGDPQGAKIVVIADYQNSGYNSDIGKFVIESDGSCEYRFTGYLTTQAGVEPIKLRNEKGETLEYRLLTVDLGGNLQSYYFREHSSEVIEFLKKSAWVKVVVWDYTGDGELVQLDLNGVTPAINTWLNLE